MKKVLVIALITLPLVTFAAPKEFIIGGMEAGYNVAKEVWSYAFNQQNQNTYLRQGEIKVYKFTDGNIICFNSVTWANTQGTLLQTSLSCVK